MRTKKLFALILCLSILFTSVSSVAAVSAGTVVDGVGMVCTFWDIVNFTSEQFFEDNPDASPDDFDGFKGPGRGGGFDESWRGGGFTKEQYDQSVTDLETDLGSTTLIDGGVRIFVPASSSEPTFSSLDGNVVFNESLTHFSANVITAGNPCGFTISYKNSSVVIPFDAYVTAGYHISGVYSSMSLGNFSTNNGYLLKNTPVSAGTTTGYYQKLSNQSSYGIFNIGFNGYGGPYAFSVTDCYIYLDCIPISGFNSLEVNIDQSSRPTSITGDYGIIGDNGSIIKVDGNIIVDESSSTVYNPVTNTTLTYTDYVYDYSDRSYNLTLEDGSTMKVTYGDENITINEGDTVYNVYYLVENLDGSGGDGGSGGDSDGGSGLGDAVGGFLGAVGDVLAGLISGLLSLATKALEALTGLGDILRLLGEALLGFFGGFTDFLGAVFPFLPEETFTILNLGFTLMIAAAVFKKFF